MTKHSMRTSLAACALLLACTASAAAADLLYTCAHDGSGCGARIDDGSGTTAASITVPAGECTAGSTAVAVGVEILHGHVGDLTISLQPPGGGTYTLLQRPAESGGVAGSCGGDDVRASFRDDGAAANPCATTIPAVGGPVAPVNSLAALAGPIPAGTWTLQVGDASEGGEGLLRSWELQFVGCAGGLFVDGFED